MSSIGLPPAGQREIQIKPWENTAIINYNLNLFAGLTAGQKLKKYNHEGKFAISKAGFFQGLSRSDEDSIIRLKSAIIRVFEEA
ncbi:MAG: hypothetical protein ACK47R_25285, partial [Planctomycetia bacterium]